MGRDTRNKRNEIAKFSVLDEKTKFTILDEIWTKNGQLIAVKSCQILSHSLALPLCFYRWVSSIEKKTGIVKIDGSPFDPINPFDLLPPLFAIK